MVDHPPQSATAFAQQSSGRQDRRYRRWQRKRQRLAQQREAASLARPGRGNLRHTFRQPAQATRLYWYLLDPVLGWMHLRIQAWAPYEILQLRPGTRPSPLATAAREQGFIGRSVGRWTGRRRSVCQGRRDEAHFACLARELLFFQWQQFLAYRHHLELRILVDQHGSLLDRRCGNPGIRDR